MPKPLYTRQNNINALYVLKKGLQHQNHFFLTNPYWAGAANLGLLSVAPTDTDLARNLRLLSVAPTDIDLAR
jgi:hypothetical protein